MDRFYDQQVPFMVSPSVRGRTALSDAQICALTGGAALCCSRDYDIFFNLFFSLMQTSATDDSPNSRPLSDRKRKFVDTELAQDTEGESSDVIRWSPCFTSADLYSNPLSFQLPELFQDLCQLQEIWIAEGRIYCNMVHS